MAWTLATAGWRVLVLEKGPRYTREDYRHDGGLRPGQFIPSIDVDPHTVVTQRTTTPVRTNLARGLRRRLGHSARAPAPAASGTSGPRDGGA